MNLTVEKLDDINYLISGSVANSVIEAKLENGKQEQEAVLKDFINAGIKEAELNVADIIGQPALKKNEQQGDNVYFEAEIAIRPVIDASQIVYADIAPSYEYLKANPEEVEAKLDELVQQQTTFAPLATPRSVENDDVVVIDFTGYIDEKAFEGGSAEKFTIKVGSNKFIPGFEEQLLGMEYNETKDVIVSFPEDYSAEDLAGKEAKFVVKLIEIQEEKYETPDDAFAQKVLANPDATLQTLKDQLSEQITAEEVSKIYISDLKPKIIAALLKAFDFTLPTNIVEQEIDNKVYEMTSNFSEDEHKMYREDEAKFVELRESVREEAKENVKMTLIIEALAQREGIDISEQEIIDALSNHAEMTGQDPQALVEYYQVNNLMMSAKIGMTEDKLFGTILGFDEV